MFHPKFLTYFILTVLMISCGVTDDEIGPFAPPTIPEVEECPGWITAMPDTSERMFGAFGALVNDTAWVSQNRTWFRDSYPYPCRLEPLYDTFFDEADSTFYRYAVRFTNRFEPLNCDTIGIDFHQTMYVAFEELYLNAPMRLKSGIFRDHLKDTRYILSSSIENLITITNYDQIVRNEEVTVDYITGTFQAEFVNEDDPTDIKTVQDGIFEINTDF